MSLNKVFSDPSEFVVFPPQFITVLSPNTKPCFKTVEKTLKLVKGSEAWS